MIFCLCFSMGHCIDVDTSSFRQAIWYYIHSMYGIRHDDYDYNEVNQLVERSLKAYIKTVTCFPERVTKKDYDSFMKEFKHSEKARTSRNELEKKLRLFSKKIQFFRKTFTEANLHKFLLLMKYWRKKSEWNK